MNTGKLVAACQVNREHQPMHMGPKSKDRRRFSYNEGADEPARLIEKEAIDIERENPADETEPVEQIEIRPDIRTPAFDE
jgi:hypothetical protein